MKETKAASIQWGMKKKQVMRFLTQIFQERQGQNDPDGHEHHQVVAVQVPFAAKRCETLAGRRHRLVAAFRTGQGLTRSSPPVPGTLGSLRAART